MRGVLVNDTSTRCLLSQTFRLHSGTTDRIGKNSAPVAKNKMRQNRAGQAPRHLLEERSLWKTWHRRVYKIGWMPRTSHKPHGTEMWPKMARCITRLQKWLSFTTYSSLMLLPWILSQEQSVDICRYRIGPWKKTNSQLQLRWVWCVSSHKFV